MKRFLALHRVLLFSVVALVIPCLVVMATYTSSIGHSLGQKQERIIKHRSWHDEPVKISKLKVKGKAIGMGQKFLEEDDWLKNLTISVKNVSGKKITFISLTLDFPRDEDSTQDISSYDFEYGRNPLFPVDAILPDNPEPIMVDETRDLTLSDEEYNRLRNFLNQTGYPINIKRIDIILGRVIFDDGTKWSGGAMSRRDLTDPTKWKPIDELEVNPIRHNTKPSLYSFQLLNKTASLRSHALQNPCGHSDEDTGLRCGTTLCTVVLENIDLTDFAGRKESTLVVRKKQCRELVLFPYAHV